MSRGMFPLCRATRDPGAVPLSMSGHAHHQLARQQKVVLFPIVPVEQRTEAATLQPAHQWKSNQLGGGGGGDRGGEGTGRKGR